jgi:hypothetical protein
MDKNEKIEALAKYLECEYEDITEINEENYKIGKQEYLVLTDDEAEDRWDEELENYIDNCILPDVPESVRFYFDSEKWKDDARMDGRGHSIATYDGSEEYETINGTDYYIYRMN